MEHEDHVDADDGMLCQRAPALLEPTVPPTAHIDAHQITQPCPTDIYVNGA